MSEIHDEEIGMRAFQIKKEKSVERAIEKIRHKLNKSWSQITTEQIELLRWALGEIWASHRRGDWDDVSFSSIKLSDILKITKIADEVINGDKPGYEGSEQINGILIKL